MQQSVCKRDSRRAADVSEGCVHWLSLIWLLDCYSDVGQNGRGWVIGKGKKRLPQVSWNSTDPFAIHMWFRNENTPIHLPLMQVRQQSAWRGGGKTKLDKHFCRLFWESSKKFWPVLEARRSTTYEFKYCAYIHWAIAGNRILMPIEMNDDFNIKILAAFK